MAKVFIALPVMGGYYPQMTESMFKLLQENPGGHTLVPKVFYNESLISRARCKLAKAFLDSDCDYLLSIDADIQFPADTIDRLIKADKDIISAPYPVKTTPTRWAVGFGEETPPYVEGVMQVRYVSTGFMLVKRSVIEALSTEDLKFFDPEEDNHYYAIYQPYLHEREPGRPLYLSEDYAFCQRAKDKGFEIYCDFDIHLVHWGMNGYEMLAVNGKTPSHPMMPVAHELQEMTQVAAGLWEQTASAGTPQAEYAALMQNMMSSFAEVGEMLKQVAIAQAAEPTPEEKA